MFSAFPPPPAKPVWIDLQDPDSNDIARIEKDFDIAVPSRSSLEEIESSSRLRMDGDELYLSMAVTVRSPEGDLTTAPLGFVLSPKLLMTVRYSSIHGFDSALTRLGKLKTQPASADTFVTLTEAMVDFAADSLESLANELSDISRRVFRRYTGKRHNIARSNRVLKETLTEVGAAGDRLARLRDSMLGLQRIVPYVSDKGQKYFTPELLTRLKTADHDLRSLTDFEVHLNEKIQFLLDAILGFINTEQNDIFKVLTIVSVVGIPPTFIASMYGMNFHNMPELTWRYGYEWGLFLIVLSTILPIIWFKWRGWW